jgi:hypothetical protein
VLQPRAGPSFAQSALLDEILFQSPDLLIEQVVCLVDKTKREVGYDFGRAGFAKLAVSLTGDGTLVAELANVLGFFGFLGPDAQTSSAQKILVIDQKFFQAGPDYVDEFDLHLLGAA